MAASERLPDAVKQVILGFREHTMGVHRVALVLKDGHVIKPVFIAWGDEIVTAAGSDLVDVDPTNVVQALDMSEALEM